MYGAHLRGDLMFGEHISGALDGALTTFHLRVMEMGSLVLQQVREAVDAHAGWRPESAEHVLELEQQVEEYNRRINESQLVLIARYQPVASDLRGILAMAKIVVELERASGEAKRIARTVLAHESSADTAASRGLCRLAQLAIRLLRSALEAFDRLDGASALEVIDRDKEELDAEYDVGLRLVMTRAMDNPQQVSVALDAAFALKSLVRIGDHARNVAQYVARIADPQSAITLARVKPAP